jgi:predicted DCC family thiol-disulfide oxidoreductase YuxK
MKSIILFDGVCNFCNKTVNIIIKHDRADKFRFAPLQSVYSQDMLFKFGLSQQALSSVILIEEGQLFTKSDAVIKIAHQLSGWPQLFFYMKWIPKVIRNFFYDVLAKYRYRLFGKQISCMVPSKKNQDKFLA